MEKIVDGRRVALAPDEVMQIEADREAHLAGRLDRWRETAKLSRRNFCIACFRAGLLSADDAVIAAKGDWPASFAQALAGLTPAQQAEAQIEWAAVVEIRRNAPLLTEVQKSTGVTDAQLDALFGWAG